MNQLNSCADAGTLDALIRGDLATPDASRVTVHLENCTTCQSNLLTVASGEIPISDLVAGMEQLTPPNHSAYWKAIAQAQQDFPNTAPGAPGSFKATADFPVASLNNSGDLVADRSNRTELQFLKPSDDPAYIGTLHHFEIARVIGRGGMGIVLEAFDTHLQRNVAIKVLNPQYQKNELARQRFCREGRAAAAISHEHVVAMHQVAHATGDEVAYLVMQLIDGETLDRRLLKDRPLPAPEVARIGMQIAAGLSAAHARGMVHRDIKPGNILIEKETDRVKLTDFGLARAADDIKLTQTGMVTGTPLYMSPEQAMGGVTDERSDLFSLGVVMYEMATGHSPFEAASAVGVMKRIMDEMPAPPFEMNPQIRKPLSDIIMALLAKQPEHRPETSASVATALAGIVTEYGPISPLQIPAITSRESKRLSGDHRVVHRGWVFGAWAAVGIALLSIGAIAWLLMFPPNGSAAKSSDSFPSIVLAGNPGTVWSVDFSPSGKEVVAAIEDGSVRLWDIESQSVLNSFNAHRGIVWMVKFHPSMPWVLTCGEDGRVKLWNSTSFEFIKEWNAENPVRSVAFSPANNRIVAGDHEGTIHVYDIDTGTEVATQTQPGSILGVDCSANGKYISTVGSDKIVRLWDAATLTERQTMHGHDGPIYNVRFSPDSKTVASVGWNRNVRIWNVETGVEISNLVGSDGDVWGLAFCDFGGHLVTGDQDGAARLWRISDGTISATLRGHEAAVHNIALHSATHRIATGSRDGTIRIWDLSGLNP